MMLLLRLLVVMRLVIILGVVMMVRWLLDRVDEEVGEGELLILREVPQQAARHVRQQSSVLGTRCRRVEILEFARRRCDQLVFPRFSASSCLLSTGS